MITNIGIDERPYATFWWFGTLVLDSMNEPDRWISYELRCRRDVDEMTWALQNSPLVPYFVEYH